MSRRLPPLHRSRLGMVILATLLASAAFGQVRILVAYTPRVESRFFSLQATINTLIASTNAAFEESQVSTTLVEAGRVRVTGQESSDMSQDLTRLWREFDGAFDEVYPARRATRADLVVLLVDSTDPDTAGIAYLLQDEPGEAEFAFAVVDLSVAGAGTFIHEVGHLFGAGHAPDDTTNNGFHPYSRAHRFTAANRQRYATVMAQPSTAAPILQFSNPRLFYVDTPTGIPDVADNARTLNATRDLVAAHRADPAVLDPATSLVGFREGQFTVGVTAVGGWNVESIGTAPSWVSVTPTEGSGSGFVTVNYSRNTTTTSRRAVFQVGGAELVLVQEPAPPQVTLLTPATSTLPFNGGQVDLTLSIEGGADPANVTWSVSGLPSWLTATPASGRGSAAIALVAQPYSTTGTRTAVINIAGRSHNLTQTGPFGFVGGSVLTTRAGETGDLALTALGGTGPTSYSLISGNLPAGVTLRTDGSLSGARRITGSWTFGVEARSGSEVVRRDFTLVVEPRPGTSNLANISTLGELTGAESTLTAGFIIQGTGSSRVLIRAAGPALGSFGLSGAANPRIEVFASDGNVLLVSNDDWGSTDPVTVRDVASRVGAFAFPENSLDAALVAVLAPGAYTVVVRSPNAPGATLVEVYRAP